MKVMTLKILLVTLLLLLTGFSTALAQETDASISLRVAILKQAFRYERKLSKRDTVRVAVVYPKGDEKMSGKFIAEFASPEIYAAGLSESEAKTRMSAYDVVFLMTGVEASVLRKAIVDAGVLSVTGAESVVRGGNATVGIVLADGKAAILMNRSSAKAERREFFGEILQMVKQLD